VAYKTAGSDGTEGGTTLTVTHGSVSTRWQIVEYSGVNLSNPMDVAIQVVEAPTRPVRRYDYSDLRVTDDSDGPGAGTRHLDDARLEPERLEHGPQCPVAGPVGGLADVAAPRRRRARLAGATRRPSQGREYELSAEVRGGRGDVMSNQRT
jgi:hypothetical protein